ARLDVRSRDAQEDRAHGHRAPASHRRQLPAPARARSRLAVRTRPPGLQDGRLLALRRPLRLVRCRSGPRTPRRSRDSLPTPGNGRGAPRPLDPLRRRAQAPRLRIQGARTQALRRDARVGRLDRVVSPCAPPASSPRSRPAMSGRRSAERTYQLRELRRLRSLVARSSKGDLMKTDVKAMVILSGGFDSVALLHWALREYSEVRAVSFDYGQPHRDAELFAAQAIAADLGLT